MHRSKKMENNTSHEELNEVIITKNIKKMLYEQLELLVKQSKNIQFSTNDTEKLVNLNKEIVSLADCLLHYLPLVPQNQSFYGVSTNHPYVVQLPAKDLVDLYVARAQLEHQCPEFHKK